jgi:hypothetical protein
MAFEKGSRVRLSTTGASADPKKAGKAGTIVGIPRSDGARVRWDGYAEGSYKSYSYDMLESINEEPTE